MTEKIKYFDRMMSRRDLNKFDASLLSNDGGKYSPSIRRLRQHYFPDVKSFPNKIFLSPITTQTNALISSSSKCNDCQKHDGLFQCCHCNQRLCIRCCNKHHKKVTNELEQLHELTDRLLTKIVHIKTDLEKQKNETIEKCHQWRIETINTINKAHTLTIQTIHDEYEISSKEYDLFVEKEMASINIDQNELLKMKKRNLATLLSSTMTKDSKQSVEIIKQRIETFAKRIDDLGKFSFQVKLPRFDIDETLRVESCFGESSRSTSAIWQNDECVHGIPSTESEEIVNKESSQITNDSSPSNKKDTALQSDGTYETASLHNPHDHYSPISTNHFNRRHTLSFSPSPNDNEDTCQSPQHLQSKHEPNDLLEGVTRQIEQSQKDDGFIRRHRTGMQRYGTRRRTTALPIQSPSSLNTDQLPKEYPWIYYRTNSIPSFIQ